VDNTWAPWQEAFDNEELPFGIERFVQHRLYAWVPRDIRFSRDRDVLPQFIYKHFVLKWWGKRFEYMYYYTEGDFWGYTSGGRYQFEGDALLFSIPLSYAEELVEGEVSIVLEQLFEDQGFPLSENARLYVQEAGVSWQIKDGEAVYVIKRIVSEFVVTAPNITTTTLYDSVYLPFSQV